MTMQTRFRSFLFALGSLWLSSNAWAQTATPPAPAAAPAKARAKAGAKAQTNAEAKPNADGATEEKAADEEAAPASDAAEPEPVPVPVPPAADDATALPPATRPANQPAPNLNGLPAWPEPAADAAALQRMQHEKPAAAKPSAEASVIAEDWWSHARPILELHGDFRVRWELFYKFSLNRTDRVADQLWARPPDSAYADTAGTVHYGANLCTGKEAGRGSDGRVSALQTCRNNNQAGANLRFRLRPELHISDNLRVMSQIDLLDNVVFGSTGSYNVLGSDPNDYHPYGLLRENLSYSGANATQQFVRVKRVWGEYSTPVGELRFGRMPNHWGLGIVNNSGDGYDDDVQSTIDRIQFIAGIKPLDLYLAASWDFPNEGISASSASQSFDFSQLDDVDQYVFSVARKKTPELTKLALTRGDVVVNGGVQLTYRHQLLDPKSDPNLSLPTKDDQFASYYTRRDAWLWLPDLWLQIRYKEFRFEAEAATIQGHIGGGSDDSQNLRTFKLSQWGVATELSQRLLENRLNVGLGFGWASGDPGSRSLKPVVGDGPSQQIDSTDRTISEFRFNPAYRVDLILHRNLLTRVQGTYYFRPSLAYDFLHDPNGQRVGGSVAGIWTRASEFIQAPGHERDLGIELDGAVYFQSKDGALNDDANRMGGFQARVEYGVLFPMGGLGSGSAEAHQNLSSAMIVRLFLGVQF